MIRGQILGEVWATRRASGLDGRKLVLVAVEGEDRAVVAFDTQDARVGDEVLVAMGSGARKVIGDSPALLCDAAVALILDGGGRDVPG
jgi:ethanolamine utilization protein EutN